MGAYLDRFLTNRAMGHGINWHEGLRGKNPCFNLMYFIPLQRRTTILSAGVDAILIEQGEEWQPSLVSVLKQMTDKKKIVPCFAEYQTNMHEMILPSRF